MACGERPYFPVWLHWIVNTHTLHIGRRAYGSKEQPENVLHEVVGMPHLACLPSPWCLSPRVVRLSRACCTHENYARAVHYTTPRACACASGRGRSTFSAPKGRNVGEPMPPAVSACKAPHLLQCNAALGGRTCRDRGRGSNAARWLGPATLVLAHTSSTRRRSGVDAGSVEPCCTVGSRRCEQSARVGVGGRHE